MNFRNKNNILTPMGTKLKRVKALKGTQPDEVTIKEQHEDGSMSPTYNNLTVNGTFTAAALVVDSVAPAITAKAGGGQDATLALSKNLNIVTTVATAGDSVTLPTAVVGQRITIVNLGANALAVFPYTSDIIDDEAVDASVTVQPESSVEFNCYTTVKWQTNTESLTVFDKAYITGLLYQSLTTGITAFATGGQASATALTKNFNNVTVCATAGDSVKLPSAEAGLEIVVKNSGATSLDIFPATGDSIDALAVNLAVRIAPSSVARFFAISATVWESNVDAVMTLVSPTTNTGQLVFQAAASAGNTQTTVVNASQAAARTYTIPDAGGNASFVMTEGAATLNGTKTFGSPISYSNTTGITAFATGGQASATALTTEFNNVTVCATAGDSVKLPAAATGLSITVKNSGATACDVFPATGDSIDALAVNLAVRIQPSSTITFKAIDATVWESNMDASLTLIAPTTNTGQLEILSASNAGNTVTTVTNASQAGARTYTIPDAGASASFAMTEGAQTINGAKTFGSRIVSVGITASGTAATEGYLYTGTLVNTVGATPQTLNALVGTVLFNAIADTAAGTDVAATQVINNSFVAANTRAIVSVFSQTVAANSCFVVKNVTMGAGTITVTLHNAGSATSGAGGACGISFTLYQL